MLHLLVLGYGETPAVQTMVATAEKVLRQYCKAVNANVYDLDHIWKCEAEPARLKKRGRLTLSTRNLGRWKNYSGILDCQDYDALYQRWFSAPAHPMEPVFPAPYYSRENLAQLLREGFRGQMKGQGSFDDFSIHYHYDAAPQAGKGILQLHWSFDDRQLQVDKYDLLRQFHVLIARLDETAPEAFCSAYISALPNRLEPTAHLDLYDRWLPEDTQRYLLGAEQTIYVGNQLGLTALPGMLCYPMKNGSLFTAPEDLWSFDRVGATARLQEYLIPAYSCHGWSVFYANCQRYFLKPQSIHVYGSNRFEDIKNPTIVLAHGLSDQQVDERSGHTGAMERLYLRTS